MLIYLEVEHLTGTTQQPFGAGSCDMVDNALQRHAEGVPCPDYNHQLQTCLVAATLLLILTLQKQLPELANSLHCCCFCCEAHKSLVIAGLENSAYAPPER